MTSNKNVTIYSKHKRFEHKIKKTQELKIQTHTWHINAWAKADILGSKTKNESGLTVSTSVYLQSEPDPPGGVPVQRDQAEVASYAGLSQFVLDHGVCITVAWESLEQQNYMLAEVLHPNVCVLLVYISEDPTLVEIRCPSAFNRGGIYFYLLWCSSTSSLYVYFYKYGDYSYLKFFGLLEDDGCNLLTFSWQKAGMVPCLQWMNV